MRVIYIIDKIIIYILFILTVCCIIQEAYFTTMFSVVEFDEGSGGGLAVINSNWVTPRKKEVFWPPYKDNKRFLKAVKNSEPFNTETWNIFNITKIFYETDDFEKALHKMKLAENTSDMQTESEELELKKRHRKPPKHFSSSDESEVENTNSDESCLPRPPLIKNYQEKEKTGRPKVQGSSLLQSNRISQKSIPSAELPEHYIKESTAFQTIILELTKIQEQNKLILRELQELKKDNKSGETQLPADFCIKFPVTDINSFQLMEELLNECPENFKLLTTYFSSKGGKDLVAATNRLLRYVLADELASKFSYWGKRADKQAFGTTKIKNIVIAAVRTQFPMSTEIQIEDIIKIWLKHAPQRVKKV